VAKFGTSNSDRTISLKRLQCVVENNECLTTFLAIKTVVRFACVQLLCIIKTLSRKRLVTSYRYVLLGCDSVGTDVSEAHTATISRTELPIFQPHDTNFSKLWDRRCAPLFWDDS
jgi:hypothetical protein